MKKIYLSFLCVMLLAFTNIANAQINFGARAGLNVANLAGVNFNGKSKLGLHAGGYVKLNITEKLRFQPELLFSMKGYTFKNSAWKESQSLNYLDIPLMLSLGGEHFRFLIGAQYSLLLGAKYKYKPTSGTETETENKDFWKGSDIGLITGIEYELDGGLNFNMRFSYGFPPLVDNPSAIKLHTFLMQFGIGYTLGKD